jgi:hypothetical protein
LCQTSKSRPITYDDFVELLVAPDVEHLQLNEVKSGEWSRLDVRSQHGDALRDALDSAATRDLDLAIPQGVSVNPDTDVRHSSGTSPLLNRQPCAEAQDKGTRRADRCVDLRCLPSPSRL